MWLAVTSSARQGNAVTSSTLLADPPSNETIDVFYIKKSAKMGIKVDITKFVYVLSGWMHMINISIKSAPNKTQFTTSGKFLISNFCRVPYVVCFRLGNSMAFEFRGRGITQKKAYNKQQITACFGTGVSFLGSLLEQRNTLTKR